MLAIVNGSQALSDQQIAELAEKHCQCHPKNEIFSLWFSTWIATEPSTAIPALNSVLSTITDLDDQINITMAVATGVFGRRGGRSTIVRCAHKTPEYLKTLNLLYHKYITVDADINRAHGGAYTPTLRDDAQDARDSTLSLLSQLPGKHAYLALLELANKHPIEYTRLRLDQMAKERAAQDADLNAWSARQFLEFCEFQETVPTSHAELFHFAQSRLTDLKHILEQGDNSDARLLVGNADERIVRNYIGGWCRDRAQERYHIVQEEELADAKRPDMRFLGINFDAPVPVELKIADKWGGRALFERLKNQLCGDYLRDKRSKRGIFLLVYKGEKAYWTLPKGTHVNFVKLITALQQEWRDCAHHFPEVEDIAVIGIDLTTRIKATNVQ